MKENYYNETPTSNKHVLEKSSISVNANRKANSISNFSTHCSIIPINLGKLLNFQQSVEIQLTPKFLQQFPNWLIM